MASRDEHLKNHQRMIGEANNNYILVAERFNEQAKVFEAMLLNRVKTEDIKGKGILSERLEKIAFEGDTFNKELETTQKIFNEVFNSISSNKENIAKLKDDPEIQASLSKILELKEKKEKDVYKTKKEFVNLLNKKITDGDLSIDNIIKNKITEIAPSAYSQGFNALDIQQKVVAYVSAMYREILTKKNPELTVFEGYSRIAGFTAEATLLDGLYQALKEWVDSAEIVLEHSATDKTSGGADIKIHVKEDILKKVSSKEMLNFNSSFGVQSKRYSLPWSKNKQKSSQFRLSQNKALEKKVESNLQKSRHKYWWCQMLLEVSKFGDDVFDNSFLWKTGHEIFYTSQLIKDMIHNSFLPGFPWNEYGISNNILYLYKIDRMRAVAKKKPKSKK